MLLRHCGCATIELVQHFETGNVYSIGDYRRRLLFSDQRTTNSGAIDAPILDFGH